MRQNFCYVLLFSIITAGCATTTETDNDWNMQNTGKGLQIGAVGSHAGAIAPFLGGIGVVLDIVGGASAEKEQRKKFMKEIENIDP